MDSSSEMGAAAAFTDGIRRVNRALILLAGLCLVTFLIALPLSLALRGMIEAHLGDSLAADSAAAGATYQWWQEFSAQASGLGIEFSPGDCRGRAEPRDGGDVLRAGPPALLLRAGRRPVERDVQRHVEAGDDVGPPVVQRAASDRVRAAARHLDG